MLWVKTLAIFSLAEQATFQIKRVKYITFEETENNTPYRQFVFGLNNDVCCNYYIPQAQKIPIL